MTDRSDGEIIAPGFRLYSPDSAMGVISDGWVITGRLPREGPWRMFNHYDLQGKLVTEGLLRPVHCDSELGMFCVYPPDEATARLVGAWLDERLSRGPGVVIPESELRLLSDPDRLARVDAALANPVGHAYRRDVLVTVLTYHRPTATSGCHCGWDVLGASQPEHVADEYEAMVAGEA